jgi:uncharacterized protein (TIGR03067 family)
MGRRMNCINGLLLALVVIGCNSSTSPTEVEKPADVALAKEVEDKESVTKWPGDPNPGNEGKSPSANRPNKPARVGKRMPDREDAGATSKPVAPEGDGGKDDLKKFQGTWKIVDVEYDGGREMAAEAKHYKWVFQGDKYTILHDDKPAETWLVKLNSNRSPKTIDSSANIIKGVVGRKLTGIYEISGNTLRICYDLTGHGQPDDFRAAKGSRRVYYTFQRQ